MFANKVLKETSEHQAALRHTLALNPEFLFSADAKKNADNTLFIDDYRIGECHCSPEKARNMEQVYDDQRFYFEEGIVKDLVEKDKKHIALLGIGTGYLLPTASLCAKLAEKGIRQISLHLVDPIYERNNIDWLQTKKDFFRLMKACGIECNEAGTKTSLSFSPLIAFNAYEKISQVPGEILTHIDVAYCYDLLPPSHEEMFALTTAREKLTQASIHLSFDGLPDKKTLLDLFTKPLFDECTSDFLPLGKDTFETYHTLWKTLLDKVFSGEGVNSFDDLERRFQTAAQSSKNAGFQQIASIIFFQCLKDMVDGITITEPGPTSPLSKQC